MGIVQDTGQLALHFLLKLAAVLTPFCKSRLLLLGRGVAQTTEIDIRALVRSENGSAEALIRGSHDHIVYVKKNGQLVAGRDEQADGPLRGSGDPGEPDLRSLRIDELLSAIEQIPEPELEFLLEAIDTNLAAAEQGLQAAPGMGLGANLRALMEQGALDKSLLNTVKMHAAAAADARMGGLKVPIIGVGGSGNHGITYFITVGLAHRYLSLPPGASLARSLAFGILLLSLIKQHTGILTPICGCAVAAGAGATAAITHLLGGSPERITAAVKLLLGNLAGLVCDGAKYGCALKVGTSAAVAVESALLAIHGADIADADGIVGRSLNDTLENLGTLHRRGMSNVDETILDIILAKGRQVENGELVGCR